MFRLIGSFKKRVQNIPFEFNKILPKKLGCASQTLAKMSRKLWKSKFCIFPEQTRQEIDSADPVHRLSSSQKQKKWLDKMRKQMKIEQTKLKNENFWQRLSAKSCLGTSFQHFLSKLLHKIFRHRLQ